MSEKRDIAKEIAMREKAADAIAQVRTTGKGYLEILDEVLEIIGYDSLRSTLAATETQRDEAQAGAAQMREALESYVEDERELCSALGCGDCKTGNLAKTCIDAKRTHAARTALSTTAGRDFLERMRSAETHCADLSEALMKLSEATNHFCEKFCEHLGKDGECEAEECIVRDEQHHAKACLTCYKCFRGERGGIACELVDANEQQDAALAAFRKCLQGLVDAIRSLEGDVPDSALCLGMYGDHMGMALQLLASDSGKATLEYIKGLEADNEAMSGLLKQTQKDYELCPGCDPETGVYGCEPHDDCGALKRYLAIDAYLKGGGQRG